MAQQFKQITIWADESGYNVVQVDRLADRLGWDEMIGQVIHLTHPSIRRARYPMLTEAERRVEQAKRELRAAESALIAERKGIDPDFKEVD